ncbi:hypothetical protein D3C78_1204650 [compost metagenome]
MLRDWVTILLLAFGIIVAVIGVIAYLSMYRKDRLSTMAQSTSDVTPPNSTVAANRGDSGYAPEPIEEKAANQD